MTTYATTKTGMRRTFFIPAVYLFLLCLAPTLVMGQITAATCSKTDVQTAVNSATDGQTVTIPACSSTTPGGANTWGTNTNGDTPLTVNKNITIQGQGVGSTVLIDKIFKGDGSCSGAQPLVQWNIDGFTHSSPTTPDLRWTGITVQGNAPDTFVCQPGHFKVSGTNSAFRYDHSAITNQQTVGLRFSGCVYGVEDHDTWSGTFKQGNFVSADSCGGSSNGDYVWSQPTNFGGSNFLFLENDTFTDPTPVGAGAIDGLSSRIVFRFNTASFLLMHGTESGQRARGGRAAEIYKNTFIAQNFPQFSAVYIRSGTWLVWGNAFQDNGSNTYQDGISVVNDRDTDGFVPWGFNNTAEACDGRGLYDNNGSLFYSGTVTAGGTNGFTISGTPGWSSNQLFGYGVVDVTQAFGSTISANGSNTISSASSAYGQPRTYSNGDTIQIYHVNACLDQAGHGQGVLLSGSTPSPTGWVSEALDPIYSFANTKTGSSNYDISTAGYRILANRDYYDQNASFNGTTGTGFGTRASRPATCTTGVAYWSTDQGSWNSSGSGGQGVLDKCIGNAWTNAWYTPFTYPHPLAGGTAPTFTLSTATAGTGTGTITGCAGSTYHAGNSFACTLNPSPGSIIGGASGCGGTLSGSTYSGTMTASCTVTATFTLNVFSLFTITTSGTGSGSLAGTNCTTGSYPANTPITCNETPAAGSTFTGWTGPCSGTATSCTFNLTANTTLNAAWQGTAGTPTFAPSTGSYGPAQSVAISSTTSGATIYYTIDGSTPNNSSAVYSSPIAVSVTTTVKALAAKTGYTDSSVASATYTINGAVADPVLSPAPGAYGSAQSVTITTATGGATIRYTTDGSQPSCSGGTLYTGAITVSTSEMLGAIGCKAGFSDSNPVGGTYLINGAVPTPLFTPSAGAYAGTVTVTISDALQNPTVIFTANAGSNGNASNGDAPSRNMYTNCIEGYNGSAYTPTGVPLGEEYCTAADKTAAVANGGSSSFGVVTSSTSGVGTHALQNGHDAGGTNSAASVSQSFGGTTSNACSTIAGTVPSGTQPGLNIPGYTAGTTETFSLTTKSSNFNTSYLGPTKWVGLWDAALNYVRYLCQRVSTTSGSGLHLEFDLNHNISTGIYFGLGLHMNFNDSKLYYCPQGCSSWKALILNDGTDHTTISFPANHDLGFEIKYHRDPGCTASSGSNCMFYDKMCIQDLTASGANTCYVLKDALSGLTPGGIPVNKTTWTRNEAALQHQIDANQASLTETGTVTFDNIIGYATPTVTIYYTTDGSTPTTSSTVYTAPLTFSSTTTLKAIAVASGYTNSAVKSGVYTINGATADPTFSPVAGTYTTAQAVTLSDTTAGAAIHYTTDGSTPTSSSTVYSSPIAVPATVTIKALAIAAGFLDSNVVSALYTITGTVAAPTFSPVAGAYATTQSVTISTITGGATLRYTTNGVDPTCSTGTIYSSPVSVSSTLTLKAIGCEAGFADSSVSSAAYTINGTVATPTFSPVAGTYTGTQSVTIACATSGATIYYTTDGSTPTTSSAVYSSAIAIATSHTVKALATKAVFTDSAVGSAAYVINPAPPTVNGLVGQVKLLPNSILKQ